MLTLQTASGDDAIIGRSCCYFLERDDFVSSAEGQLNPLDLGVLGFPRDWPAVYKQSAPLKTLIGKHGSIAAKRVAVAGVPSAEDQAHVRSLTFYPLQSFANAERAAAHKSGLEVVRGWAVFERLDRPVGEVFVAERYWWNALPDGKWVDLTPRPASWPNLLLAEASRGAPKKQILLTSLEIRIATQLMLQRFPDRKDVRQLREKLQPQPKPQPPLQPQPQQQRQPQPQQPQPQQPPQPTQAPSKAKNSTRLGDQGQGKSTTSAVTPDRAAKPVDYSKWKNIVDSEDEDYPESGGSQGNRPEFGVKDLADGKASLGKQPPPPDYLVGNTGGGGGTNCFLSVCKLLDNAEKTANPESFHQLSQVFGKAFHSAIHDWPRQEFFRNAIAKVPRDAFVVVLGLGSVVPFLRVASRGRERGVLFETSTRLADLAGDLLTENGLALPVARIPEGFDNREAMAAALALHLPAKTHHVVILTERFANDMLSNGVVPANLCAHAGVLEHAPETQVHHIPQIAELYATPMELRSEFLGDIDIRPFNAFRHTTSNEKADFWWWGVRLDNQSNVRNAILGPTMTLCGFDFNRSPEIVLDEVRRSVKLEIESRGRCNAVALWWTVKFGGLEYTTKPRMAMPEGSEESKPPKRPCRSEWKQAIHYLAGETAVFPGDVLELLVSITPRFTLRMMQQSPFSVEAPPWIRAPVHSKFSATLPILPYHFLMLTDLERLKAYGDAIRAAVRQAHKRLRRRPRVLDVGCGIGLLGMTAALEGAEVWLCEAVGQMRQMCREVVAVNASAVTESKGLVQLLPPMMSTHIRVGEHVEQPFDLIVSEVMDLWCLGEGVLPTMKHAFNKLLAPGGEILPSRLVIFAQPLELLMWSQAEREHKLKLSALTAHFQAKFSPLRIDQVPHRWLCDDPIPVLEIDLRNVPNQPADGEPNLEGVKLCIRMGGKPALAAKISSATVQHSGILSGYGIWWAADLGNGHVVSSAPSNPQRSWKQLIRWLDEPRFVSEGEDIQVLACYNNNQVNVEDVYMPRELVDQCQQELKASVPKKKHPPAGATAAVKPELGEDEEDVIEVD